MTVMAPASPRGFLVSIIHVVTGNNFAKRHPATDPRLWRMEHASRAVPKERAGRNLGLNPAVTEAKVLVGATSRPLRGCPCASMLLMILQRCIMVPCRL